MVKLLLSIPVSKSFSILEFESTNLNIFEENDHYVITLENYVTIKRSSYSNRKIFDL